MYMFTFKNAYLSANSYKGPSRTK